MKVLRRRGDKLYNNQPSAVYLHINRPIRKLFARMRLAWFCYNASQPVMLCTYVCNILCNSNYKYTGSASPEVLGRYFIFVGYLYKRWTGSGVIYCRCNVELLQTGILSYWNIITGKLLNNGMNSTLFLIITQNEFTLAVLFRWGKSKQPYSGYSI